MSYTPPTGNQVDLPLGGGIGYVAPTGDQVPMPLGDPNPGPVAVNDSYVLTIDTPRTVAAPGVLADDLIYSGTITAHTSPAHGALTFNSDGSFTYTPTTGYLGADSFTYTLGNDNGFSTATVSLTVLANTIRYLRSLGGRIPWNETVRRRVDVGGAWSAPVRKAAATRLAHAAAPRAPRSFAGAWTMPPRRSAAPRAAWAVGTRQPRSVRLSWPTLPRRAASARMAFGMQPRRQISAAAAWLAPPRRRAAGAMPFVMKPRQERSVDIPWNHAPRRLRRVWIPWNAAHRVPYAPGSPGIEPPPITPPPVYVPPAGAHVDLPLVCLWFDESAQRLALPIGPFACYAASIFRRRYIVLNTASVVRLPERTPIDVSGGTVTSSVDDMYFTFSLTLANPDHLAYLLPDGDGNKQVEINLNGYVFVALIESYQQQRKFPSRGVTVTGRSRTVVLDDPIAPPRSFVQDADATAHQLVDRELQFTGFTSDYGAVDWVVPAGVYAYSQSTPMQSIRQVAAASGSIVQSHAWDAIVKLRPRYPVSPWAWTLATPDKIIQDDVIISDSLQPATKPLYNYVLVSGQQVGVSDPILRAGSAGDVRALQIVDPLIATHPVALERGRNALCDRGNQAAIELMIPLGIASDSTLPGLVSVLDLCEVVEPTSWRGLCTGVRINFQTVNSGNGAAALIIDQYVTVERHYQDAD
jgi:hypothetical protein